MISTYHKDEMHETTNKANQEGKNPVAVCNYNINMLGVDLADQMLWPYLLEQKNGTKRHLKLLNRLLNVAIQNTMIILSVSHK